MFFCLFSFGQSNCTFQKMNDTTLCSPGQIEIWVKGSNLDKVKWEGENILVDDTLYSIKAAVSETTTFYVSNRILDSENLVINGDFESGNQDFTSNYWSSCFQGSMPQGSYCINSRTDTYWSTWNSCSDRNQPGTGNMFVTDGAVVPDEEIWCQTVIVDPNTDYALSAWITPVLNLNNAILQFTINSDTIGESFTAKPTECQWNEFFEIWNSGINTSAKICITNENRASNGNDFAMDDIALNKVCYQRDSVRVTVIDSISFELNNDTSICPGDNINLTADTLFDNDFTYNWSTGESSKDITVSTPEIYHLTVTHFSGCSGADTTKIEKIANPESKLYEDTTVCLSIKGGLDLNPGSAKWFLWNHPNGTDTSQIFKAEIPGIYDVTLFNGTNCFTTDRVEIKNFCATELFIPNSFTPNGDDRNDTFGAEAIETYYYHLQILNRFGKIIFESFDIQNRWSGDDAPEGVYVYYLDYRIVNKEFGVLNNFRKIGTVTLIR